MIHYKDVSEAQKLCECLACPARAEILKLVLEHKSESLDSLAKTLHLTNGAISQHVKKLCALGLLRLEETPGKHGTAKRAIAGIDRIMIDIATEIADRNTNAFEIPIGQFSSASVNPYCALVSTRGYIGERDDPRYFTYPERADAALIYFYSGRISWTLPAVSKKKLAVSALSVTLELSSKPSGHGHSRESNVTFFINDVKLGAHTVNGEFTDRKGFYTPVEFDEICEYGRRKTLRIDGSGSYIDGIKIGDATVSDISSDNLTFTLATDTGVAIFGKGFGDYDSGIVYKVE